MNQLWNALDVKNLLKNYLVHIADTKVKKDQELRRDLEKAE